MRNRQTYAARRPRIPRSVYDRAAIFARWDNQCCYCDAPASELDHVLALSRGGADEESNLVPACRQCNADKAAQTLAEWAA
ncbi:HNH endonuclease [Streptomyces sp. NBC_01180]|uniref:HNH endonuclease n=1 Tax=Streptomyces sp. NBC_01180 TaxID=2903763 RepID=UPI003868CCD5